MKIAVVGVGYVGLPAGTCLAEMGHNVFCVDKDSHKINRLKQGDNFLFEEKLDALFSKNIAEKRLTPTLSLKEAVDGATVVLLCVGTPENPETHEADLTYIITAAEEIAPFLKDGMVVAVKSTVPVGAGDMLEQKMRTLNPMADFDVVSLPEFLREGFAVYDFMHPDRIVVGTNSPHARNIITQMYAAAAGLDKKLMFMSRRSAETVKYASNSFLAVKLHYINEMADLCAKTGADIDEVSSGMGADTRIGARFLCPGPGYGGSCLPKDTNAVVALAKNNGVRLSLVETVINGNESRISRMAETILSHVKHIKNPKIGVLGLAFKKNTDDVREPPAVKIVSALAEKKCDDKCV